MIRTDLINYLIQQRGAARYLEVGVHDEQNNFVFINCGHKITTFPGNSNLFFENNDELFDIIFIDGIHTEEQTLKDIKNACQCLATDGVIVLHDCMPPDAWHQREQEAFRDGENWNGTVWKAVLRVFNESTYKCTLLNTDYGCGIIDTTLSQIPKCRELPEKLDYELHYPWLLEYQTSVAAYLREQVKVFYHLACINNWQEVFVEQMEQLRHNGFQRIDLTVLGTAEDLLTINKITDELKLEVRIIFQAPELTYFEKPAMLAIEEYARQNDGYVLYVHSKGVSNPASETKVKWRRLMMRELVENWEFCLTQLPHYDLLGVNWRDFPTYHFSGNFWYAATKYLRKLSDFKLFYDTTCYPIWDPCDSKRLSCEFWISSCRDRPRVLSVFCKNVDFNSNGFWKHTL